MSAFSSHQAGLAQQRASQLQQSSIQADQAFRKQQLDAYNKNYGPMEQQMIQKANSESPLNLGPNWSRIQSNFDTAGRNNETSLARKGMLGSGADVNNTLEGQRAYSLSDAFSKGLQNRDALRTQLMQAGKNMPQQAGFVAQGNQNMSNFWGNQANLYAGAAGGAAQGMGSSIAGLGYALGNYPGAAPAPTVDARMMGSLGDTQPLQPGNTNGASSLYPIPQGGLIPGNTGGDFPPTWPQSTFGSSPITGSSDL
jgi:hypothetical protein